MLEAMLMGGGSMGLYFPNSGPGSKFLVMGNTTMGYFGMVTPEELFTRVQLQEAIGVFGGTLQTKAFTWVKVMMDSKVLFVPSEPVTINTSWNALNSAGAVYGDSARIYGYDKAFKMRLPVGDVSDPTGGSDIAIDSSAGIRAAEWFRFIAAVGGYGYANYSGPRWQLLAQTTLGQSGYSMMQNTVTTPSNSALALGVLRRTSTPKVSSTRYWLPFLELDQTWTPV